MLTNRTHTERQDHAPLVGWKAVMVHCTQATKYNNPHKWTWRRKSHIHFYRCIKSLWQKAIWLQDECPRDCGTKGKTHHHIKSYIWRTYKNIILNGENFEEIPLKLGMRERGPLSSFLFDSVLSINTWSSKAREGKQRATNREKEEKYPHLKMTGYYILEFQRSYQKTSRNFKTMQQCGRYRINL